ncbi:MULTISPECIES: acyl carrier protein [unclassified Oceanispirochaeta]|uniref:acyl carrier protein n=1 Tax=unclassified Oceanispirochaeta TaxID=2635722 RepID=UPI000E09A2CE|nr:MULTISPECIES: acyl carrier protein [unclassified Oceanispirochaeta]MBF9015475.1 acyl carrier protein [Oceanispirochaeta sp. M2]NPD71934.1 acyl carrier protein [Oceanispirochaeta sp. M1]RDG32741.1 acyl carrier protein [Oceanispirochaeta sp. M1]
MTRDDIFEKIVEILNETFEIPKDQISPDSLLEDDLDLDSIDAVDLIVKLKKFTEKNIDPTVFKQVRTINDIVDALESLVALSDS